jgi:pimeloyl-ACP methyl ester carboxylesterase
VPTITANGIDIAYQESGSGFPLILAHEFAGSMESWEAQVHFFSRRYRVITYNARGYPPTEVPDDAAQYGQDRAVEDMKGVLDALGIQQAYVGGLSMGGSTTLHFGLRHPEMARALIVAAAGTGSDNPEESRALWYAMADAMERDGMASALAEYAAGPARVQLMRKDPTGYEEFRRLLFAHSPRGSANTMRGVQAGRPPLYVWEEDIRRLRIPTLIMTGDEDEPCINPSIFMKRLIGPSGLVVFPQSGHAINLEEPELFNRAVLDFLTAVEAGRWATRDA